MSKLKQVVTLNAREEVIVRAFFVETELHKMLPSWDQVHVHNIIAPYDDVKICMYHAGAQEFDLDPSTVTACAIRGIRARDVLDTLLSMDKDGVPVVTVDHNEIYAPAYTHMDALQYAVHLVVNKAQ